MSIDEIREAYLSDEVLEYRVTGKEIDRDYLLPDPGWYPCTIIGCWEDGDVEIDLTTPKYHLPLHITVLKGNIPIAFRHKQAQEVAQ